MENLPLQAIFDQYLQYGAVAKGFRPATVANYRDTFTVVLLEIDTNDIHHLDRNRLERFFLKTSTARRWAPHTYFTHHKNLKAFFNWAVTRGIVLENPVLGIDRPRLPRSIPKSLTVEDANRLVDAAYHLDWQHKIAGVRNRAIIATFAFAGLRRRELMELKRRDVDLDRREIFVFEGKGGRDRVIPINSRLHFFLSEYAHRRDASRKDCLYFFTSLLSSGSVGETGIRKLCNRLKEATGIHFTPHMLRHTFATLAYKGSKDILAVSASMGHSNVKTTQIYAHADADSLRAMVELHPMSR